MQNLLEPGDYVVIDINNSFAKAWEAWVNPRVYNHPDYKNLWQVTRVEENTNNNNNDPWSQFVVLKNAVLGTTFKTYQGWPGFQRVVRDAELTLALLTIKQVSQEFAEWNQFEEYCNRDL
jgi:hypothetical protein